MHQFEQEGMSAAMSPFARHQGSPGLASARASLLPPVCCSCLFPFDVKNRKTVYSLSENVHSASRGGHMPHGCGCVCVCLFVCLFGGLFVVVVITHTLSHSLTHTHTHKHSFPRYHSSSLSALPLTPASLPLVRLHTLDCPAALHPTSTAGQPWDDETLTMDDLRELAKEQHNLAQVLMQTLSIYLSLSLSHTHKQTLTGPFSVLPSGGLLPLFPLFWEAEATAGD